MVHREEEQKKEDGGGSDGRYTVYAAGELFTQHDLATNVLLRQAVWEQSAGKYELMLPQSKEMRDADYASLDHKIRDLDLLHVLEADFILARFDGVELDSGTVVEFMAAKFLGKPAVILRSDGRRMGGNHLDDPYNLMVRNWPRTVEIHADALINYVKYLREKLPEGRQEPDPAEKLKLELRAVERGIAAVAAEIIRGLDEAAALPSPYPEEFRQQAYRLLRFSPGSSFGRLLAPDELDSILARLTDNGTL